MCYGSSLRSCTVRWGRRCRIRRSICGLQSWESPSRCSPASSPSPSGRRRSRSIPSVATTGLPTWRRSSSDLQAARRLVRARACQLAAAGDGLAFFVGANNLMTLFLALEWFSISLYILCAIDRDRLRGLEAALKYLVIGGFGSAVLLFGSALVYGTTGKLDFPGIAASGAQDNALLVFGLAMLIAGPAFKASAAPFHMWTPDAYDGPPTPVH